MIRREGETRDAHDERIREALDELMLDNPITAHIVHSDPLSEKYKKGGTPRRIGGEVVHNSNTTRAPREPTPYEKRKAKARSKR